MEEEKVLVEMKKKDAEQLVEDFPGVGEVINSEIKKVKWQVTVPNLREITKGVETYVESNIKEEYRREAYSTILKWILEGGEILK